MTDSIRDQLMRLGFARSELSRPASNKTSGSSSTPAKNPTRKLKGNRHNNAVSHQLPDKEKSIEVRKSTRKENAARIRGKEEIDLAKAYALRERHEREERELVRRESEARAAEKRLRKMKLRELTYEKSQNDSKAEHARHFPHMGKIKRIYVNETQLPRLNNGELGVVVVEGRYLLVDRETALAVQATAENALVLLPDASDREDLDFLSPDSESPNSEETAES